ncbi:Por secretion system protein [Segatella copri]|uniref:type IX secretion system anionic LPS delivery protein PorZ n=1 Tax=Segatella copri TaxID=165179 RepID=UPI001C458D8B|nr:Por secretion system protein [Segatella copri]WOZ84253.1 Por secretion system protein [Segatella copri]
MSKKILILLSFLLLQVTSYRAIAAIGDWKAYMAYSEVQELEQAGNLIFVQASNNLYVYNQNDQSIQTFSKMDYLSDCGIQHIAYNKAAKRLLIFYSNANMDLMNISNYDVQNLSDYYSASTTGEKTVNDIYMYGKYAYMSNGFGIIKVNVADGEISDTYNLGFKVNWCEIKDSHIYAYSQTNGQYRALLNSNLLDKNNWSKVGGYVAKKQEDKSALKQIISTLQPGGPKYNNFYGMRFVNNLLYTCGGLWGHLIDAGRPGTIQVLDKDNWTIYDDSIAAKTGIKYVDVNSVDVDPLDPNHVFAGAKSGLYEFQNGKFIKHYNSENSLITSFNNTSKNYQLITSVKFDTDGNLWMLNSQSPSNQSLIEYTKDGKWVSHHKPELYNLGSLECLMQDSRGLLWFVNNHHELPSIYCYQASTDQLNKYSSFVNEDGATLSPVFVRYVTEDKNQDIWIGTNIGPLLLYKKDITSDTPIFTQVKVPRNDGTNYADYLLSGVDISCIAIDGSNRKWFGTNGNGIYVISNDCLTQIYHFTTNNSNLLSNNIEAIAINEQTGEVFAGTDKGLCSYLSDASSPNNEMTKDNVWAYPNPVKPDYTGLITITGLSFDADIKIVTTNGILINQGRSNGGTYTWNGKDLKGQKVASGIYMVETATSDGSKGTVCKIAIVK